LRPQLKRDPLDRRTDMSERRHSLEEPVPEAYSRVTNAERFRPLHRMALDKLGQLESTFAVERRDTETPDLEIKVQLTRPSVQLVPRDLSAAPVVVSFTDFPGLYVRCGRWFLNAFPSCGCDACDEGLEDESRRFGELIENVVAGRFSEAVKIPVLGAARLQWAFAAAGNGWQRIDRKRARALVGEGPTSFTWKPWSKR
jgi:Family of unknown function (DUF6226)